MEAMSDSSSDSDISSDEEGSEMSDVEITEEEVQLLEEKVKQNLYNYESHVALVSALRSLGDLDKVREARERMSSIFPLPEDEWQRWIDDEEAVARLPLEKEQLANYYERATSDYQSVALWEKYGRFMEVFLAETDPKRVRNVYEDAVTAVGLHVTQGGRVWSAFRGFEFRREETENVRKLFHRQLAIPLAGMENTYQEYEAWESEHGGKPAPHVEKAYQTALKQLEDRRAYESHIAGEMSPSNPDYSKLEAWKVYLRFEEEHGNPARVQCLYERAVKGYCLVLDIWKSYIDYLEKTLANVHDVIVSVHARAVRNYPWSGDLWSSYIRALERAQRSEHEIRAFFEKGLAAGLASGDDYVKLFESLIDYYYRNVRSGSKSEEELGPLRTIFERAVKHLEENFPGTGLNEKVSRYWATLESRQLGNPEKGVAIWEELIKSHGAEVEAWLEYISLSKTATSDGANKARSLFKRACNSVADWPEKIFEQWLLFEREVGTLEDWDLAKKRVDARAAQVMKIREKEQERQQAEMQFAQAETSTTNQERRRERTKKGRREEKRQNPRQKAKVEQRTSRKREREEPVKQEGEEKDGETADAVQATKKRKVEKEGDPTEQPAPVETDGSDPKERTVFLGNLPFSIDEKKLREVFTNEFGAVADVRIVRNKLGRSKGFAFLEFAHKTSIPKALERKDLEIEGRVVGIQEGEKERKPKEIEDSANKRKRTYNDKHTVFVSNLSFATTEEDLRQEFSDCGNIKALRLIRDKKQKSKGFAYIEWEEESSIQAALAHSQKVLKGRPLNVAISQPPKKEEAPVAVFSTLAKRPATMLVPRVVKRAKIQLPSATTKKATEQGQSTQEPNADNNDTDKGKEKEKETQEKPQAAGKKNAYFKALYSKGK